MQSEIFSQLASLSLIAVRSPSANLHERLRLYKSQSRGIEGIYAGEYYKPGNALSMEGLLYW